MSDRVGLNLPDFLVKDYELKVAYLTNHLTRMWTRFGMFVTLESALVAVLIVQGKLSGFAWQIALVQLVLSVLWLGMGRHDRHLVRIYKYQIEAAANQLRDFGVSSDYCVVSDVVRTDRNVRGDIQGLGRLLEARSVNDFPRIPALLPALLCIWWSVLLVLLIFL